MFEGARIAVVVPARNEARWIEAVLRGVPAFVDRLIVVDDASDDGTGAAALAVGDARVAVVRHARPRGVGAAIATGYLVARAGGADVAGVMAGDGQMDPGDLRAVVGPVARGEADYVKGDRFRHPDLWRAMPLARIAAGFVLARLTRAAAGLPRLSDSQCGYAAISAHAIDRIDVRAMWPGYGYPNDLVGRVALAGLRIAEVPVRPVYAGQRSGIRPWHVPVVLWIVARTAVGRAGGWRRDREGFRSARPLVLPRSQGVASAPDAAAPCQAPPYAPVGRYPAPVAPMEACVGEPGSREPQRPIDQVGAPA